MDIARLIRRTRRWLRRRGRQVSLACSSLVHLAVILLLFGLHRDAPKPSPPAVEIALASTPTPQPAAQASAGGPPVPTPPKRTIVKPKPTPVSQDTRQSGRASHPGSGPGLSAADIAGAANADEGPTGRQCDMARWIQAALRRDRLVLAALAGTAGKALLVWNGDWVRDDREDGKGLAAVREAIMWEVGFAPAPCRAEEVRGLVLISLPSESGVSRLALGAGYWRWSDLLNSQGAGAEPPGAHR